MQRSLFLLDSGSVLPNDRLHKIIYTLAGEDERFVELEALGIAPTADESGVPPSSYGSNLFSLVSAYAKKMSALARDDSAWDVIHAHDWLTVPAALELKRITGKPLVLHIHSTEYDRSGPYANPAIVDIEQNGLNAADAIVAVSAYTRDVLVKHYAKNINKITVIYNAVTSNWGQANTRAARHKIVTVSFLGRVTYQKGPHYFIEAARKALAMRAGLQFVMAGDGDLLNEMRLLAAANGLTENIYFPGFLKSDEARHLMENTDIYVMPSVSEPFGITALEAIRAGAAAIVSRQAGVAELIDNIVVVDYSDVDAIAKEIVRLADDTNDVAKMSARAALEIDKLSWEKSARKLLDLYLEIVDVSEVA